jgi:DinB superfamily
VNTIAEDLRQLVESTAERLRAIPEPRGQVSQVDGQWSPKQILGHLIDSAANNHQRFVRAQFSDDLVFPGYDQEQWIRAQRYEEEPWSAIVELWRSYNLHLAHVIDNIPESTLTRLRPAHTLDKIAWKSVKADQATTLEYLVRDYVGHLKDHLEQIFITLQVQNSEVPMGARSKPASSERR